MGCCESEEQQVDRIKKSAGEKGIGIYVDDLVAELSETPTCVESTDLIHGKGWQYKRRHPKTHKLEMMTCATNNGTMNIECFTKVEAKHSVFEGKVLKLKSVCWMDPKGFIQNIPMNWGKVHLYIYHGIGPKVCLP